MIYEWMNEWCTYYCCKPKALYNHVCVCVGGGGHLDDATAATWQPCQCAHHTNYRWRGERIIVMNILLNKYFCCTVFKKIQTFILTGCREYLYISVCIWYEDSFTQMKRWNAHKVTLRAVLDRDAPIDRPVIRIVRFRTCPARIGDRPGQSHVLPIPEK